MRVLDLGIDGYDEVLAVQTDLLSKRISGEIEDTLVIAEHTPVVTFGRIFDEDNVTDKKYFDKNNIPFVATGRGGRITYHSPGQLVMYPIVDLNEKKRDLSFFIDLLEKTAVSGLKSIGVPAERNESRRGVWVNGKKAAFIGLAVKKWVTYHGIAININNGIDVFDHINTCGECDIKVTSAKEYLGHELDMDEVKSVFIEEFIKNMIEAYDEVKVI